jgi:cytochrome c553
MFRLPRRFVAALLWIVIALLPVRGLASVMMPMVMSSMPATVASAPVDDTAAAMPCHGATADQSSTPAGSSHTCSLCDLCHGAVAQVTQPSVSLPVMHEAQPEAAAPPVLEPRAPDSLFRPPRTSHA